MLSPELHVIEDVPVLIQAQGVLTDGGGAPGGLLMAVLEHLRQAGATGAQLLRVCLWCGLSPPNGCA